MVTAVVLLHVESDHINEVAGARRLRHEDGRTLYWEDMRP